MPSHRVVVEELPDERELPRLEPAAELVEFRGTGPDRGAWEDSQAANDVTAAEYIPPRTRAA